MVARNIAIAERMQMLCEMVPSEDDGEFGIITEIYIAFYISEFVAAKLLLY